MGQCLIKYQPMVKCGEKYNKNGGHRCNNSVLGGQLVVSSKRFMMFLVFAFRNNPKVYPHFKKSRPNCNQYHPSVRPHQQMRHWGWGLFDALADVRPTGAYLLNFFSSGFQFYLLLSPYQCFISFLYLNLYVLGDDALIS